MTKRQWSKKFARPSRAKRSGRNKRMAWNEDFTGEERHYRRKNRKHAEEIDDWERR